MKIAICDDEAVTRDTLSDFIEKTYHSLDLIVDKYSSGQSLLQALAKKRHSYDLLLLDIEMPGLDGMQTAKRIRQILPELHVVFITSHDEFALSGYEVSAYRFLVKPVQPQKLIEAIESVKEDLLSQKSIMIRSKGEEAILKIRDILYFEAQNQNVKITLHNRTYANRSNIDFYESLLCNDDFYRIHRSYLVNLKYITFIGSRDIKLSNGDLIPVSRLRKTQFTEAFQAYMKRTARYP